MVRLYLDNCVFNRPFDDQSHLRISLETQAKLNIQQQIKDKQLELIWSYILSLENAHNPHEHRSSAIIKWRELSIINIVETRQILSNANKLLNFSIQAKDALHIASAIEAKADYFLTTDDQLLFRANASKMIKVLNPIDYIKLKS